jgi:hypothetical protein
VPAHPLEGTRWYINFFLLAALVTMGPSGRHISPESLATRIRALPSPVVVIVDVQFRVFQRRERHARP